MIERWWEIRGETEAGNKVPQPVHSRHHNSLEPPEMNKTWFKIFLWLGIVSPSISLKLRRLDSCHWRHRLRCVPHMLGCLYLVPRPVRRSGTWPETVRVLLCLSAMAFRSLWTPQFQCSAAGSSVDTLASVRFHGDAACSRAPAACVIDFN